MSTRPPAPSWPYCAHGAHPLDPVGCRGIHVPGHTTCLAHLTGTDRDTYLAGLVPGADIDHRGTPFTEDLLNRLLNAVRDPTTTHPHLGTARFIGAQFPGGAGFDGAHFSGDAWFGEVQFSGDARFGSAQFSGGARFNGAQFSGDADFGGVQFSGDAWFDGAQFSDDAWFSEAQFSDQARFDEAKFSGAARLEGVQFSGAARFDRALFSGDAGFGGVHFSGDAGFGGVQFSGDARFDGVQFSRDARFHGAQFLLASWWGPAVCVGTVDLSGAVFGAPVTLEVAARQVRCARTRWQSTATVRVRHASVDLGHAVLEAPIAVTAHPSPFTTRGGATLDESTLSGVGVVRVVSVQGVDAAHLVLTDTDLSDCLFSGAFHLDQLRLEGRTTLAFTPTGWHRKGTFPVRWTRRRTLAEEQHWRAQTAGQPPIPADTAPEPGQWRTGLHHPDSARTPDPDDVAALYRQLRKAFEDGKNEPGAADFYYGECEMRRHDRTGTPKAERRLLWAYWLLSGYGLRAGRALGWLAAAMVATIVLLMAFGLPMSSPKQEATGTVPAGGGTVTFTIDKQEVKNPTGDRFTGKRFDKALGVTLNSVVFRSSGQDLTTTGTYIEMTSRLLEPALLALAVLAIRGRIKR
ncbi:pentapeptide repeat-containing protein [Streptomyces bambusae]|uniref:pentapeptide repeat-containing protein n=1 Tax=Streptomyces bambusae TaxID=1550616 RepID=UPI001CFE4215|nr:pentapeptide repeat-containing protein [Streptomyces bambusae]MCB5166520.1 pentapeptide repeat-containing protein [Streptomyces bambusae]